MTSAAITLPNFLYPPVLVNYSYSTPTLNYNDADTVNVSWQGYYPSLITTQLVFCQRPEGGGCYPLSWMNVSETGWRMYLMNTFSTYPVEAFFNLRYIYEDGNNVVGPFSFNFFVNQDPNIPPRVWSAVNQTAPDPASTSLSASASLSVTPPSATTLTSQTVSQTTSAAMPSTTAATSQPGLSAGAIAGIVIGVIILILLAAIVVLLKRRKGEKEKVSKHEWTDLSDRAMKHNEPDRS